MPIPVPPLDKSGGYILVKYTDGLRSHRIRMHVIPFNRDATGTYVAAPAHGGASVQATAGLLMAQVQDFVRNTFTISLDAVFQVDPVTGVATEYFGVTPPAPVAGGNAGADIADEVFIALNYRTALGGHARFFFFHTPAWSAKAPDAFTATTGPAIAQSFSQLFAVATNAAVGHDGSAIVDGGKMTYGINRKLRRRQGWA